MDADYSVELGPDAPALEIPWRDPAGLLHYFDLRTTPAAIEQVPEASEFPALRQFLVALNSPPSQWQTAKCDVWTDEALAAENLYNANFTHSCYVDLVLAGQQAPNRDSLDLHEHIAETLAQSLDGNESLDASAEIVIRRCYFHHDPEPEGSEAGYALTLFLTGYGTSPEEASRFWQYALEFTTQSCLRCPIITTAPKPEKSVKIEG
jgi:hypothetical protein